MVARVARLVDDVVVQRHKDVDGLFDRLMRITADLSARFRQSPQRMESL